MWKLLCIVVLLAAWPERVDRRDKQVATFVWNGVDGNWATTTNWTPNGSPGASSADTAIFDGTSNVSLDTNLDRTADTGTVTLIATPDYTGDWGASGNPLQVEHAASADYVLWRGTGQAFLKPVAGGGPMRLVVDCVPANGQAYNVEIDSGAGTGLLAIKSGRVNVAATCQTASPDLMLLTGPDAFVNIPSAAFVMWQFINAGGEIVSARNLTSGTDSLWNVNLAGTTTLTGKAVDLSTLIVLGGRVVYNPTADVSAEDPTLLLIGGTTDLSKTTQAIGATDQIIGPFAELLGNITASTTGAAGTVNVDLREDFPKVE